MTHLFDSGRQITSSDFRYEQLCKAIGILGIVFPFVNIVYDLVSSAYIGSPLEMRQSLSCYYWSLSTVWFVGVLWIFGIILLYYSRDRKEGITTTIAGILAFCIAAFPTQAHNCGPNLPTSNELSSTIHDITAASFFLLLTYLTFLFTRKTPQEVHRSEQTKGENAKDKRNRIYIWCGSIMLGSAILDGLNRNLLKLPYTQFFKPTFILESIMLVAFGIAWLTRSHSYNFLHKPKNDD